MVRRRIVHLIFWGSAHGEVNTLHSKFWLHKIGEVFATHSLSFRHHQVFLPHFAAHSRQQALCRCGVIDGRWSGLNGRAMHFGQQLVRQTERTPHAIGHPVNTIEQQGAHIRIVRTNGQLHLNPVANDVVLGSTVNGAHRDNS